MEFSLEIESVESENDDFYGAPKIPLSQKAKDLKRLMKKENHNIKRMKQKMKKSKLREGEQEYETDLIEEAIKSRSIQKQQYKT